MKIFETNKFSDELLRAMNDMIPRLSPDVSLLSADDLHAILQSESSHLLVAKDDILFVGMLTLIVYRIPTGIKAWIEDVVVEEAYRGRGIGRSLIKHALAIATETGATTVDLTSRPSREAANVLYRQSGFEQRQTNVYRYKIT